MITSDIKELSDSQLQRIQDVYAPFADAQIGIACIHPNGQFLLVNDQLAKFMGYQPHELIGMSSLALCEEDQYEIVEARLSSLFKGNINSYRIKRDLFRKDGTRMTISASACALKDTDNTTIAAILIISNVESDSEQKLEVKKLSYAVENSGSAVIVTDPEGRIEYANSRFCEISGYDLNEVIGKTPSIVRSENTPKEVYKDLWETVLSNKQWRGSLINKKKDGSHYWAFQSISPIFDEAGILVNIVSVSDDISAIKEHESKMEQLAFFDPLTSLGNRRKFRDDLDILVDKPRSETLSALLLLDLDHFKQINDTLGHDTGDELLVSIANRLRFCTSEQSSVYRLGGDEFTILMDGISDADQIEAQCREIIALLAQPVHIGPHELPITVSIGITLIHEDADEASSLLRNADIAMYQAKKEGRNTFSFYAPYMDYEIKKALSLEHDLRHAIDNEELVLHFQPLLDLATGKIMGVEALCRWHHSIHGDIEPEYFISKAEETGLIHNLGAWVVKEACTTLKHLHMIGYKDLFVSMNVSTRQFENQDLCNELLAIAQKARISTHHICLEVTEAVLLEDVEHAMSSMQRIKDMGFKLAIDDFGTGFSSLNYLKRMPVDTLKIDRSFVQDIPEDNNNATITSMVILMAEKLGLTVFAEGIEQPEQQNFLLQNHCYAGQGFLYCKPLQVDELIELLNENSGFFISPGLNQNSGIILQ